MLKPGGYFITQQVGGRNMLDLSQKLVDGYTQKFPEHDTSHCVPKLAEAGFDIILSEEAFPSVRIYDLGAVVFYARARLGVTWFLSDSCFENLYGLRPSLGRTADRMLGARFNIAARKVRQESKLVNNDCRV